MEWKRWRCGSHDTQGTLVEIGVSGRGLSMESVGGWVERNCFSI